MNKTHHELGRAFVFAGLTAALALGIIGSCCYRRQTGVATATSPKQISRIEMLDAQARPHFEEARRNIPSVVDQMTGTGALCKLCWLMSRDKITGSHKTQDYLESILNGPIVGPCRAGAKVYGCDITVAGFVNGVKAVNSDYALTGAYALTGLSIEALFLKKTIASLRTVLGRIVARLAVSYRGGTACAAADGPLPIGDIIGIVMAAGGTVWSAYDLYQVKTQLGPKLKNLLQQSVRECQAACRMEALK
jgi:hypothetical protein